MATFIKHNIDWRTVIINDQVLNILKNLPKEYYKFINFAHLSENPDDTAIKFLELNPTRISWYNLCKNTNKRILVLLNKYPENIDWISLSGNPSDFALDILENNIQKICWHTFSENSNDRAVKILLNNIKQIKWNHLTKNKNNNIISILNKFQHKIDWFEFFNNNNIFKPKTDKQKIEYQPVKKNYIVSDEFIQFYNNRLKEIIKYEFVNKDIPKITVTKMIYAYIKANNLFERSKLVPDDAIKELFKIKKDEELKFSNIHHFIDRIYVTHQ